MAPRLLVIAVELAHVDVQKLSAGYRASKVIGSSVVNDANETIGKIDDLLVSPDGKQPYAVLSIGGFLGMGTHLVVVPYDTQGEASIQSWNFPLHSINPSIPNLFIKKPGLVPVVPIISASPPCLSLWIDQPLSGERSCVDTAPR
jgi:PRC-barrel domain